MITNEKLYMYEVYDNFEGICTEDFKEKVIDFWTREEFENDREECENHIDWYGIKINEL